MGSSEKFCLRWNDFETNISVAFRELREDKDFFDVTIACDDNQVQAHKVILSACSPFFRNVLKRNPHQHPLLYLKGVKYQELLSVINFMYMGEVNVAQEELNSFLSVAEDLRVKGLTQNNSSAGKQKEQSPLNRDEDPRPRQPSTTTGKPSQRPRPTPPPPPRPLQDYPQDIEIQEVVPVKNEPRELSLAPTVINHETEEYDYSGYDDVNYEEVGLDTGIQFQQTDESNANDFLAAREAEIVSNITKDEERKMFTCALCQFGASSRHKTYCHIESQHFQDSSITYQCQFCDKSLKSRNALGIHVSRNHKQERGQIKNSIFPKDSANYF